MRRKTRPSEPHKARVGGGTRAAGVAFPVQSTRADPGYALTNTSRRRNAGGGCRLPGPVDSRGLVQYKGYLGSP